VERADAGAGAGAGGGGGGGTGDDRNEPPVPAGVSLPLSCSRSPLGLLSLGGAICALGKGWILRVSSMICIITVSESGDLTSVCNGKEGPWPSGFDFGLRKGFDSTPVLILGGGGGNSWKFPVDDMFRGGMTPASRMSKLLNALYCTRKL
jgi:hypothetical protein